MPSPSTLAIIILGHGSRVVKGCKNVEAVAKRLKEKYNYPMVNYCFLSPLSPNFPETLEKTVAQGAKRIIVIPYLLNEGLHIILDIPAMMQEEALRYPDVTLILGKNLGYDETLVDLVEKRLQESQDREDIRTYPLPNRDKYPVSPSKD